MGENPVRSEQTKPEPQNCLEPNPLPKTEKRKLAHTRIELKCSAYRTAQNQYARIFHRACREKGQVAGLVWHTISMNRMN